MKKKTLFNIIMTFLFVIGVDYLFDINTLVIFNVLLLFLVYELLEKDKSTLKDKKIPFIFTILLTICLIVGKEVYLTHDIGVMVSSFSKVLKEVIAFSSFSYVSSIVIYLIYSKLSKRKSKNKQWNFYQSKHIFGILFGIILASWVPAFLAYFPGIVTYDIQTQTNQVLRGITAYDKHHPPLHTFIWQICANLGQMLGIEAITIYTIIQMLFLALVFAYLIKFLIDNKVNNYIVLFAILFFTINPVIALCSLLMTKDIFFAGFLILLTIQIIKLVRNVQNYLSDYNNWLLFILFALLCAMFRNNFIYAYIIFAFILIICFKKYYEKMVFLAIFPILAFMLINNILFPIMGIKNGSPREMLSVPIEQISNVVTKHDLELDNDTKKEINNYIFYQTALEKYDPRISDPVKYDFNTYNYVKDKVGFYKTWGKLFLKYPVDYISAAVTLNLPYWYLNANSNAANGYYIETENNCDEDSAYIVESASKLPLLKNYYDWVASYDAFRDVPIIANIFSISMPIWLMLFVSFYLLFKGNKKLILAILPMILFWLTYLLGPVSNFRYIIPIFVMYPLLIAILFDDKKLL